MTGAGAGDCKDILLMPGVDHIRLVPGKTGKGDGYASTFKKSSEKAAPGFYEVTLDNGPVKVELTTTKHVGIHRYTFPATREANILMDLNHGARTMEASVRIVNNTEIEGYRFSSGWVKNEKIFFIARFSRPFDYAVIASEKHYRNGRNTAKGKDIQTVVTFTTKQNEPVVVKVALSAVSIHGARENLKREAPHWDFDKYRKEALQVWNDQLNRIRLQGASTKQKRIFYTALYHTMIAPYTYMDVTHRYRGMDDKIHKACGFDNYTCFSLWDTYRALHPWFTLFLPGKNTQFIRSLIQKGKEYGSYPKWELYGNDTRCMIGYPAVPVIADALVKGDTDFDVKTAYELAIKTARLDSEGLNYYRQLGYVPADKTDQSVSRTLEYAFEDWCIAQMAKKLGYKNDYRVFMQRSGSWKNLFDPVTGFMRGKTSDGKWIEPFDPSLESREYTEGTPYHWMFVPQDTKGLIHAFGGEKRFVQWMDTLFQTRARWFDVETSRYIYGFIGKYAQGNEPDQQMPYLYDYADRPCKTAKTIRRIMALRYHDTPDGLPGNEDAGQMSAWYIFSSLGFYPVCPGSGKYVLGVPAAKKTIIDLGHNKKLIIRMKGKFTKSACVTKVFFNKKSLKSPFIKHKRIMQGGELLFVVGKGH